MAAAARRLIDLDSPPGHVLVIGHRGAEALAPENTWAALRIGAESGADLLEIDVQLSRDGEAILFHDFSLYPKFRDVRWVRDLAWDELASLDVGSWFSPSFAGERIPRFADVLAWARGRVALQVDLKHGFLEPDNDRLEMRALHLIEEAGMLDQVIMTSWDEVALGRIRAIRPEIALGVNLSHRVPDPVVRVAPTGARWVCAFWPQIDRQTVECLHREGFLVNLVNLFTADYREALRLGVDAVTANDPRAARVVLA